MSITLAGILPLHFQRIVYSRYTRWRHYIKTADTKLSAIIRGAYHTIL